MLIVSCDPGITGAVSITDDDRFICAFPVPVSDGKIDAPELKLMIESNIDYKDVDAACIELVHAMPQQGLSSTFKFGHTTGMLEATLSIATNCVPKSIRPQDWKKYWGLSGTSKETAVAVALSVCPTLFSYFEELNSKLPNKKLQSGMADAYLLGTYYYSTLTE